MAPRSTSSTSLSVRASKPAASSSSSSSSFSSSSADHPSSKVKILPLGPAETPTTTTAASAKRASDLKKKTTSLPTRSSNAAQRDKKLSSITSIRYLPLHNPKTRAEFLYLNLLSDNLNKPKWWERISTPQSLRLLRIETLDAISTQRCNQSKFVTSWPNTFNNDHENRIVDFLIADLFTTPIPSPPVRGTLPIKADDYLYATGTKVTFWPMTPEGVFLSDDAIPFVLHDRLGLELWVLEQDARAKGRWHDLCSSSSSSSSSDEDDDDDDDDDDDSSADSWSTTDNADASSLSSILSSTKAPPVSPFEFLTSSPPLTIAPNTVKPSTLTPLTLLSARNPFTDPTFPGPLPPGIHITVSSTGKVTIDSYINNIQPSRHASLYGTLGALMECLLPMLNAPWTLTMNGEMWEALEDAVLERARKMKKGKNAKGKVADGDVLEGYMENVVNEATFRMFIGHVHLDRSAQFPKFSTFLKTNKTIAFSKRPENLPQNRQLQLHVKCQTIHLTPSNPRHPGTTQSLLGTSNEAIAAFAVFPYDLENIDLSYAFTEIFDDTRIICNSPDDEDRIQACFGIREGNYNTQRVGKTHVYKPFWSTLKSRRIMVAANRNSMELQPFSLKDPKKPGFIKILTLGLVHPTSTQNPDWLIDDLWAIFGTSTLSRLPLFPPLVVRHIADTLSSVTISHEHNDAIARQLVAAYEDCGANIPVMKVAWGWDERMIDLGMMALHMGLTF
ncbi:hypothetical protein BC829DRAFT_462237 [Chytridium lagenaria]|nr:hypothetical protein BC829DRAFT_462237 [Chytridium lagenaria]